MLPKIINASAIASHVQSVPQRLKIKSFMALGRLQICFTSAVRRGSAVMGPTGGRLAPGEDTASRDPPAASAGRRLSQHAAKLFPVLSLAGLRTLDLLRHFERADYQQEFFLRHSFEVHRRTAQVAIAHLAHTAKASV